MEGYFFAGAVVALAQYLRRREPRLLPLAGLFAALAAAESREAWDPWQAGFRLLAGAAGLALIAMLSRPVEGPRG